MNYAEHCGHNHPNHEQDEEMCPWIGDDFDPQAFSIDQINRLALSDAAPTLPGVAPVVITTQASRKDTAFPTAGHNEMWTF